MNPYTVGLRKCTCCMAQAHPLAHPTLGDICVICLRPFQGAPPMPLSKKERRAGGRKGTPDVVTSEMVCQAERRYGYVPKWMRDAIDAQKIKQAAQQVRGVRRAKVSVNRRHAIYKRDEYRCVHCGTSKKLTLDHKTPRCRGGSNASDNLQTMCSPCNNLKGAKTQEEFVAWLAKRAERDRQASIAYNEQHGQRPRKEVDAVAA